MAFEPIFQSLTSSDSPYLVPYKFANGAVIVVFAFLPPLLTMEINYFRLSVFRSFYWKEREAARRLCANKTNDRRISRLTEEREGSSSSSVGVKSSFDNDIVIDDDKHHDHVSDPSACASIGTKDHRSSRSQQAQLLPDQNNEDDTSISGEAISSILLDSNVLTNHLCDHSILSSIHEPITDQNRQYLSNSYSSIRKSSLSTISIWITLYLATAVGIIVNTRELEEKVVAIIGGASKFMVSLILFIVSAKIPQWLGVYHQGSILLVKHSSPYSQRISNLDLTRPSHISKLQKYVRRGIAFHFAKFYVILMPFYCGSNISSTLISMFLGAIIGFMLMWSVFMVHKKYIHHRNVVAFTTIFLLTAISSLTFVRGMAWIQMVWHQDIFENADALLTISFFSWLVLLVLVHALFLWHTIKVEKKTIAKEVGRSDEPFNGELREDGLVDKTNISSVRGGIRRRRLFCSGLPRKPSYSSHLFDPRTHFKDGNCIFSDMSEFDSSNVSDSASILTSQQEQSKDIGGVIVEMAGNDILQSEKSEILDELQLDADRINNHTEPSKCHKKCNIFNQSAEIAPLPSKRRLPAWCEVFICFSHEYKQSSFMWKVIAWVKVLLITTAHLLFLYFVIVCIGATAQSNIAKTKLPYVHEAIYNTMNEGPVCAFDNRGPESNITTFADANAAHNAEFLVLHCGACGACSSWENLILEWTTRDTISELANDCAKRGLFGGDDAITKCLMHPSIGWEASCAACWMKDIVCTREHCAFIFLQSQMINNVGNFAVSPDDITSATCEEANCEAGNPGMFVDCSGATRRRMNITSSIARPGEQQCAIVDVKDWDDLFFGSGVV